VTVFWIALGLQIPHESHGLEFQKLKENNDENAGQQGNLNCLATEAPELKGKGFKSFNDGFLLRWECPRGGRSLIFLEVAFVLWLPKVP